MNNFWTVFAKKDGRIGRFPHLSESRLHLFGDDIRKVIWEYVRDHPRIPMIFKKATDAYQRWVFWIWLLRFEQGSTISNRLVSDPEGFPKLGLHQDRQNLKNLDISILVNGHGSWIIMIHDRCKSPESDRAARGFMVPSKGPKDVNVLAVLDLWRPCSRP